MSNISWDTYFMGIAYLSALKSKDPKTQVGAVIVNQDNKVVSIGYNGFPRGVNDQKYPWASEGEYLETKNPYVVHAELNAILNATTSVKGCKMYITLEPCNECAKAIIQAGITTISYPYTKREETDIVLASRRLLNDAGIMQESPVHIRLDLTEYYTFGNKHYTHGDINTYDK